MAEATVIQDSIAEIVEWTATAANSAGDVVQVPDGRGGVILGLEDVAIGDKVAAVVQGHVLLAKASATDLATTAPAFTPDGIEWDNTANQAIADAGAGDWYMGLQIASAAAGTLWVEVSLNVSATRG